MKAAYYEKQGKAADVLKVSEVPEPVPGLGEVRVKIAVSGINPSDLKNRSGFLGAMSYKRVIPHQDGAGIIDRVGEGVSESRIGERVWVYEAQAAGRANGTAAEYVVIPAENAVPLSEGVSYEIGACLGIPALTAHRFLFSDGNLKGKRVLVHGGAGVVGEAAIMLAKWSGAWVATTIRKESDREQAQKTGADLVINMKSEEVAPKIKAATEGKGVDRIIEVDLLSNAEIDLESIAQGGVICTYALKKADDALNLPIFRAMKGGCVFRFVFIYNVPDEIKRPAIKDITECLKSGKYRPTIGKSLPLEKIAEAHEVLEQRAIKGNIIVTI